MTVMTRTSTTTTVGNYLLDRLHFYGVRHAFGLSCDSVSQLNALFEQHAVQLIHTTQESHAGYMADVYGRMQGLGVACLSYGTGMGVINALAQAYAENSPVLFICVAPAAEDRQCYQNNHRHVAYKHEQAQLAILQQFTVDQAFVTSSEHAVDSIERVLKSCLKHKKPVYLELSRDILAVDITIETHSNYNYTPYHPQAMQELLYEAAKLMKESCRPCICIGHEVQRFRVLKPLLILAEKFHIPIVTSLLGKGAISEQHPLFVGVYHGTSSLPEVRRFVEGCDLILQCGVTYSDREKVTYSHKPQKQQHIHINAESVKINHHLYPDVHFTACLEAMSHLDLNMRYRQAYPSNIDRVHPSFTPKLQSKVAKESFFACLNRHLRAENIVIADIEEYLPEIMNLNVEQNAFYAGSYSANLGFGLPAAIAAQLIAPKKRIIAILNRNSFQATMNELSTAVRYGIDPIIIVLNNSNCDTQKQALGEASYSYDSCNYTALTDLLGAGNCYEVQSQEELQQALILSTARRGAFSFIAINLDNSHASSIKPHFNQLVCQNPIHHRML